MTAQRKLECGTSGNTGTCQFAHVRYFYHPVIHALHMRSVGGGGLCCSGFCLALSLTLSLSRKGGREKAGTEKVSPFSSSCTSFRAPSFLESGEMSPANLACLYVVVGSLSKQRGGIACLYSIFVGIAFWFLYI